VFDAPGSISPIFYAQLARRSQKSKKNDGLTVFFALLGSVCANAAHKMLGKLTPNLEAVLLK